MRKPFHPIFYLALSLVTARTAASISRTPKAAFVASHWTQRSIQDSIVTIATPFEQPQPPISRPYSSSVFPLQGKRGGNNNKGKGGNNSSSPNKSNLPSKICVVCERPFTWRKKWERCWDEVTCCSKRCNSMRRGAPQPPQ